MKIAKAPALPGSLAMRGILQERISKRVGLRDYSRLVAAP